MNKTKVDFANVCAKARSRPGLALHIEYDREVMYCTSSDGANPFWLYFDTVRWHECLDMHKAWDQHMKSLERNPPT